jgi:hypothetical protein
MPVYFLPAAGSAGVKRPTIIFTNGYDARSPICTSLPLSQRGDAAITASGQDAMLYERTSPCDRTGRW